MKNPHPVDNTWSRSMNKEPILLSVPSTNKKFKRKSREPKRLFTDPELERRNTYSVDVSDVESVDDTQIETGNITRLPLLQRQLGMSQEAMGSTTGIMSGVSEDNVCPSKGAIDMRTGNNVSAITSKLCQLPPSPFSNPEISLWPTSISQPLSNRLKLGLRSTFSLTTPAVSTHSCSTGQQTFSMETSLLGHSTASPVQRTSQTPHCHDYLEHQVQSQESPRKQGGASADGAGHHPEVKAIQQTRRLLANARERTRVHTISAAFEALRKQVPCYSYGQKLSKLAILRIACNYILSLAQLAEMDYSSDHSSLSFSQCVEQCTRTLQAEGRSKKRKE